MRWRISIFAILLLRLAGCDKSAPPQAPPAPAGNGVIRGHVILTGNLPPKHDMPGYPSIPDEKIICGPGGELKNVVVYLKDAPAAAYVPGQPAVLDQIKCVYVPHVVAVQAGQTLRLKSSDNLMHNVNLQCQTNQPANFSFSSPGQTDIILPLAEAPFPVKCDVHPWMHAWVGVFNHPWFAVTGEDGAFELRHVPPGTYTLAAWQEALPEEDLKVTVGDGGAADVTVKFAAP